MQGFMRNFQNMKWEMIAYFLVAAAASFAAFFLLWHYLAPVIPFLHLLLLIVCSFLAIGAVIGFVAALRFQRKVNVLHLGILQLSRGNLSEKIPVTGTDSFDKIYDDFNEMAESVKNRIALLQKLGEENVLKASGSETAVLEERKRLARDLHDTVSQQLFALHMAASTLEKLLDRDPDKAKAITGQIVETSAIAQKQIRGLIAQLRPVELEGRSLAEALDRWFPDYCRHNGLTGSLDATIGEDVSEAVEHQLFMIVQEAMANVVKHARARHVTLSLKETEHQYVLTIADDGIGFYKGQVQTHSYGLSTMRERANKLGGEIEILSKAGEGTRIKVQIPKFGEEGESADGESDQSDDR
jgi:signal transduction histidine kinase